MNFKNIIDNGLIFRELMKSRLADTQEIKNYPVVKEVISRLGLKNVRKVIRGCPDTIIVIADDKIIRIPLDRLSRARCRINRMILKGLSRTSIAAFVPDFLAQGKLQDYFYFCETKLSGFSLCVPISRLDDLTGKAADFITGFHKETARDIVVTDINFKRLVSNDFRKLAFYFDAKTGNKLAQIEQQLYRQLSGKSLKTVWLHGDYKIENILFDIKTWQIKGVIDWDLSMREGLPLLDILFLLIYKNKLKTGESVAQALKEGGLKMEFRPFEEKLIHGYLNAVNLSPELIKPLVILFWINHVLRRHRQAFEMDFPQKEKWLNENVHDIMETIMETR